MHCVFKAVVEPRIRNTVSAVRHYVPGDLRGRGSDAVVAGYAGGGRYQYADGRFRHCQSVFHHNRKSRALGWRAKNT